MSVLYPGNADVGVGADRGPVLDLAHHHISVRPAGFEAPLLPLPVHGSVAESRGSFLHY